MIITTCQLFERETRSFEHDAETGRYIILDLCQQYELAYSLRHGARLTLIRNKERVISHRLHHAFSRLNSVCLQTSMGNKCDVCQLIAAVSRMGKSDYAKECADYLLRMTDETQRVGFDLDLALRQYAGAARLTTANWQGKQVVKAVQILRMVQNKLAPHIKPDNRMSPVHTDVNSADTRGKLPILPSIEMLMSDSIRKMSILTGMHLRFV